MVFNGIHNTTTSDASDRALFYKSLKEQAFKLVDKHVYIKRLSPSSFIGANIIDEMKLFSDSSFTLGLNSGVSSYVPPIITPTLVVNSTSSTSSSSFPDDETAACELRYTRRHLNDTERSIAAIRRTCPILLKSSKQNGGGPLVLLSMYKGNDTFFRGIRDMLWSSGISRICALC